MAVDRRRSVITGMRLVRILIWVVTAFFVGMMFYPLLMRMIALLMAPTDSDLPY
jgi:phage shock protein PspC (stress-responsive transcriptional regulator)